jgi:adenosylcobinamide-GDP ribazoletransferase
VGNFLFAARSCLGFLTTIPVGISMEGLVSLGKRLYLFPVIGVVIGLLIGGIGYLFGSVLPPEAASVMIIVSLYCLTGINHLDGLADFGDGVVAHGSREKKIGAMRDVSLGIGGVVFCVIAVLGLFAAISGILGRDPAGVGYQFLAVMIAAEVSAKQAMLTISAFGKSIHPGLGSIMIDETGFREFAIGLLAYLSSRAWMMACILAQAQSHVCPCSVLRCSAARSHCRSSFLEPQTATSAASAAM